MPNFHFKESSSICSFQRTCIAILQRVDKCSGYLYRGLYRICLTALCELADLAWGITASCIEAEHIGDKADKRLVCCQVEAEVRG